MCKAMEDMRNEATLKKRKRQPSICLCCANCLMKRLRSVRSYRWMKSRHWQRKRTHDIANRVYEY